VVTDRNTEDFSIEQDVHAAIGAEVVLARGDQSSVAEQICEADALLNTWLPMDRELIARLRRCRTIARYGGGTDNIDVAAATDAGIVVANVPDYCVEEVATHALAMILALLRRIREADVRVRAGKWGVAGLEPIPRVS
jgi:D-3-phosphoglycerate dehydrogenase